MVAPHHPLEAERLNTLQAYNILGLGREPRFDRLVFQAAQLFRSPIALISVLEEERQWFKAQVGVSNRETPRQDSFCSFAILQSEPLIVEDASQDVRFMHNPHVVGDAHIRFYAGVALFAEDNMPLGALCVMDKQPRHAQQPQIQNLVLLAREAEDYIRDLRN